MMNFLYKNMRNKKGFTLIELIVVIAILGVLAAVAVPRVTGYQTKAKASADQANATVLHNAIQMEEAQDGTFPTITRTGTDTTTGLQAVDDSEVTSLVNDLISDGYLPAGTKIVFNTISDIKFNFATATTVSGVSYK